MIDFLSSQTLLVFSLFCLLLWVGLWLYEWGQG